ncbi:MAG TPA: phenylalanine--tRNA ligase subunit beta, partial [Gemmatimonadales bacterium]|nr:phenylalanine--tRNA ligase subunit beta [Gemmatimonadales bacterium]
MKLSRRWLESFLRRRLDGREVAERLAMLGTPVDAITPIHAELRDVVIGLVEEVRPHPNADRLRLCRVNAGGAERFNVVCGASNVAAGRKYPFAPVGSLLPGGIRLEQRKIRGETSEGMLCSSRELGLGTEHEGIMMLETDAEPGTPFLTAFELDDDRLDLDIPPVRPDLLGHKGVARELAAAYGCEWRLPEIPGGRGGRGGRGGQGGQGEVGGVRVEIVPGAACSRFTGAVIRGVKVGPSPAWLRNRLEAVGLRSISNVVDATNYIMLELGQPLHAYDLAHVPGPALIVRQSKAGETLVTLDGVERSLPEGTTVVADAAGVSGIGGIMGGRSSEVSEATTDVFLESAWWHPAPLRRTRRALGLITEASLRFERGTDLWGVPDALGRCLEIVLATAGGTLDGEPLDLWPEPAQPPRLFLRVDRVTQVLGVELPVSELERCLTAVGAILSPKPDQGRFAVQVPGWRPDLREEIDLVEEIARIHGYQNFPDELQPFRAGNQTDAPIARVADEARRRMVAEGLYEVILLGVGPADGGDGGDGGVGRAPRQVRILNPISADHGFLRSSLLPGLVREVEANWANQVREVRLFEVGTVFRVPEADAGGRPMEAIGVAAIITGARGPAHWSDGASKGTPDCDAWDLKGLFERTVSLANPGAAVQVQGDGWIARRPDGNVVGRAGPLQADAPRWAAPLFGLEVTIDPVSRPAPRYAPLPVFPAAVRDLALLLPPGLTAAAV